MTVPLPNRMRGVLERLGPTFVFPRGLMLVARSLVNLEATASVVDPALDLAGLTRPLLPGLRRALVLDPSALEQAWRGNRFEYLELALERPDLLPEFAARLRDGGPPAAPTPPEHGSSRWLGLADGVLEGLVAAEILGRRRR